MSTTLPDIDLGSGHVYTDVLAAAGIAANTTVRLQNKGDVVAIVQFGTAQPPDYDVNGVKIFPGDTIRVETEPNIWVMGLDRTHIHIAEAP